MHYSHMWGEGWHSCSIIFFVAIFIFFIIVFRRRSFFWNKEDFRSKWMSDWLKDCSKTGSFESAIEILKKRYARGEISKEEFEKMKEDIESTGGSNDS